MLQGSEEEQTGHGKDQTSSFYYYYWCDVWHIVGI